MANHGTETKGPFGSPQNGDGADDAAGAQVEPIWRIRLLGGVTAGRGETQLEHFRTQKTASLLAFLAFPPGRAVSREELIALFWPDDDLPSARHKLSVALHSLRQQLEPEGSAPVLEADRFTVRLRSDQVTTDVQELEAALASAARGGGDRPCTSSVQWSSTAGSCLRASTIRGSFPSSSGCWSASSGRCGS